MVLVGEAAEERACCCEVRRAASAAEPGGGGEKARSRLSRSRSRNLEDGEDVRRAVRVVDQGREYVLVVVRAWRLGLMGRSPLLNSLRGLPLLGSLLVVGGTGLGLVLEGARVWRLSLKARSRLQSFRPHRARLDSCLAGE